MGTRRDMDSKIIAKRRRKGLLMRLKVVYRLLLWRRKASRMSLNLEKKEEEVAVMSLEVKVAKLKAETNRIIELQRKVKGVQEKIEFKIEQKREENHLLVEIDARMRYGIDQMLDILDAPDQLDFVTANNLTQSFRELMVQQNEQAFAGCGCP